MSFLADLLATVFERDNIPISNKHWAKLPTEKLVIELISNHDEAKRLGIARQILDNYANYDEDEKRQFFNLLAVDMNIEPEAVRETLLNYEEAPSKKTYQAYMKAVEPKRQELLRRLNQVAGATGELVNMRSDLLKLSRDNPVLAALDLDFKHLFTSWFNKGFLVLRPINWHSPANILEKIIAYEAVHTIASWDELRLRLSPTDRRCFAFFHPVMPDEPLIFVEVALTKGTPDSIQTVLADDRETINEDDIDSAVFYSISNCQPGLAGISLGDSLIKQVVQSLSNELTTLSTYITLSPIPGLSNWLEQVGETVETDELAQVAAYFLTEVKRSDGLPVDPVARFHLGNGAMLHAIHVGADVSPNGMAQSLGAMVNYKYDLSAIAHNHEIFTEQQSVVASREVNNLAESYSRSK